MQAEPRAEGCVDCLVHVGGQEDDGARVLQLPKEDRHEFVTSDVVGVSFSHENVCFVQKDHGIPLSGHLENLFEVSPEGRRAYPEVFGLKIEQGATSAIGN